MESHYNDARRANLEIHAHLGSVIAAKALGETRGVYSVCSSNRFVLEAAIQQAQRDDTLLLIESTSNQVNHLGGYMNMTPPNFIGHVKEIAEIHQFPMDKIILGGDHLGPFPWREESSQEAMGKAKRTVEAYVLAGYRKIHLDASMHCGGDDPAQALPKRVAAERAAALCAVSEAAWQSLEETDQPRPCYIIGTEVPAPGGEVDGVDEYKESVQITTVEDAAETLELSKQAFLERGLERAWGRVIALVVQPGVEFGDTTILDYSPEKAVHLREYISQQPGLIFEAHSTDYQTRLALRQLVADHFGILKVGPALTFAFREAIFALASMEDESLRKKPDSARSRIVDVLEAEMVQSPQDWKNYYQGTDEEKRFARRYSLSDRARYYWSKQKPAQAIGRLLKNLANYPVPLSLLSQYMPVQYQRVRAGQLPYEPRAWIHDKVMDVLADYSEACR